MLFNTLDARFDAQPHSRRDVTRMCSAVRFGWRAISTACLFGITAVIPASLHGQTRFSPPQQVLDIASHPTVDQCHAALVRLRHASAWGVGRDTMAYDARIPDPDTVVMEAKRCVANFPLSQTPPRDLRVLLRVLVAARQWDDVRAVLERQRTYAASAPVALKAAVLMDAIDVMLDARPTQIPWADTLSMQLDRLGDSVKGERMDAHLTMMKMSRAMMDVALIQRHGSAWFDLAMTLPDSIRNHPAMVLPAGAVLEAWSYSLLPTVGVDSTLRFMNQQFARFRGLPTLTESFLGIISAPSHTVAGDFWFPAGVPPKTAPQAGRTSLLVFVDHSCKERCFPAWGVVKRLHQRFGSELDVTLVGQTHGYFRDYPPQAPDEEAKKLWDYAHNFFKLPGQLAVTTTPFRRLPDPDRRRVEEPVENQIRFDGVPSGTAIVVDRRGIVVAKMPLDGKSERMVTSIVGSLLR